MKPLERQRRLTHGTTGQIVELLRRNPLTTDAIGNAVGLTRTAVRAQLAALLRDGIVEERGLQRGPSKPARIYGISADAELQLSRVYVPLLTQLLHVLADRMPRAELDVIMREVGRGLMADRPIPRGPLKQRVLAASALLNDLGGVTEVDDEVNHFVIRGHGCPLAAATAQYPEACNALESLLSEFVGQRVRKCCEQHQRQRCCFKVANRAARASR